VSRRRFWRYRHHVITNFHRVITHFQLVITSVNFRAFCLLFSHMAFGTGRNPCQNAPDQSRLSKGRAMNIHEYQAKALLRSYGIPVSDGRVVLKVRSG
jgi:hypothetical protein